MRMHHCAYCKSEIDQDFFYCDQCGKEILLCETCNKPQRGDFCTEDGGTVVAAKTVYGSASTAPAGITSAPVPGDEPTAHAPQSSAAAGRLASAAELPSRPPPKLKLVNNTLGLALEIEDNSVIGRSFGPYAGMLASQSKVSGKHLQLKRGQDNEWTVMDLGSTNGTKCHHISGAWQNCVRLTPHVPVSLRHRQFLLIANIEFEVHIEGATQNTTERI